MKPLSVRMPDELFEWLMEKAARQTIDRKKRISMNTLAVDILMKAMRVDKKKGGG